MVDGVEDALHALGDLRRTQMYTTSVAQWPVNRLVIWVAKMANSIGNTIGAAWITVIGMVAAAGIVGMVAFSIKTSGDISTLTTQQAYIQSDVKDVKSDIREIRRGLDDQRNGRDPSNR